MRELESVFQRGWVREGTVSGPGSMEVNTRRLRHMMPAILGIVTPEGRVPTVNDAGCGELAWIQESVRVSGARYIGYDVCRRETWTPLEEENEELQKTRWDLRQEDVREGMERADLVVCRDTLIHLPNDMSGEVLDAARQSARYLLATTYLDGATPHRFTNADRIERLPEPSLQHAMMDLRLAPFGLGEPLLMVPENYPGKFVGLWDLQNPMPAVI